MSPSRLGARSGEVPKDWQPFPSKPCGTRGEELAGDPPRPSLLDINE